MCHILLVGHKPNFFFLFFLFSQDNISSLEHDPACVEECVEHLLLINQINHELEDLEMEFTEVNKLFSLIQLYEMKINEESLALYMTLASTFQLMKVSVDSFFDNQRTSRNVESTVLISIFNKYYFTPLRVFRSSISWWFYAGVWVTASLLTSPGLFSLFWPISIILFHSFLVLFSISFNFTLSFIERAKSTILQVL